MSGTCKTLILFLVLLGMGIMSVTLPVFSDEKLASAPDTSQKIDFEKDVQPILEKHCLSCHGSADPESEFSLTSSENLLKGGLAGKVVVAGKAKESPLFQMISHTHADEIVMPPEGEGESLTKKEMEVVRLWIDQGAIWPKSILLDQENDHAKKNLDHWSFQPIKNPPLPKPVDGKAIRNPIDSFILDRLEKENFQLSHDAEKSVLIRRVTLDLIGLLPTPEEVEHFQNDHSPDAYEKLVDRLLESPHFGERWATPWLDLCHYGDTDGYLTDAMRPYAWRYRDWLVKALNDNMPFDQFTIEQLAGDLLPESTTSQAEATGFLRQTLSNREGGADLEEFRIAKVIDRTKMTGTIWLGLTLECSRCHNHKYDPISQKEFYQLFSFFNNDYEVNIDAPVDIEKEEFEKAYETYNQEREKILAPVREKLDPLQAEWEKKLLHAEKHPEEDHYWTRAWEVLGLVWGIKTGEGQNEGLEIVRTDPAKRTTREKNDLTDYFLQQGGIVGTEKFKELGTTNLINQINELKTKYLSDVRAPAMRMTKHPRQAYVHLRGDFTAPGIPVESVTPEFLPAPREGNVPDRLRLARWLVSPENPLTSRVVVNRIWQEFFGKGFVISSDDFGTQGDKPSHPELLDWLAHHYINNGWNTKELHKLIVTSATYRQSSKIDPEKQAKDPANRLLGRQSQLRLSAEMVRDIALSASGLLSAKMGGPPVRPPQPKSVVEEGFGLHTWEISEGEDRYRRGIYTLILRTSPFAQSVIFDAPTPGNVCTRRERSNTPLQALTLLNDPVFFETAEALAKRITEKHPDDFPGQVSYAYQLCFSREPTDAEMTQLKELYQKLTQQEPEKSDEKNESKNQSETEKKQEPMTVVCSVLLNLHEFITRN